MNSIDFSPKLSPRFVVYLRDFLLDRNIDPGPIFLQSGIEEVAESDLALPLSVSRVLDLFESVAEKIDDPLLGFNLARHYHFESSAAVIIAMMAAPNVREGFATLTFFDQYVDTAINTSSDFSGELCSFSVELIGIDTKLARHLNEYLVTFIVQAFAVATRMPMPISRVTFQHERRSNLESLKEFFNAEVEFEAESNQLLFDRGYLDTHHKTSNDLVYEVLRDGLKNYFSANIKEQGFIDTVCRELMRQSEIQSVNLQTVADNLAVSTRTLRRRIQEEGFSFQQIKSLARERQAKYYLSATSNSLAEIGYMLGYTEVSSFSRAFRNWTGLTPQEYRVKSRKIISG